MTTDWTNHPNPRIRAQVQAALDKANQSLADFGNAVRDLAAQGASIEPKKRRGVPNKTELRRIQYWEAQGYQIHFEALKVRLADGAWFTPDLVIGTKLGGLMIEEIKGAHIREAAKVRYKVAAEQYSWLGTWRMVQWVKHEWRIVL